MAPQPYVQPLPLPPPYVAPITLPITDPTAAHRLRLPPAPRLAVVGLAGFGSGGVLGLLHDGLAARYRFRAENAHRLPTTTRGWYFYHKTKNYVVLLAGIKGAARMGAKVAFLAGAFSWLEARVDSARGGRRDFVSSTMAGASTGLTVGLYHRFRWQGIAKIGRIGLIGGLGVGLLQDVLFLVRGERRRYIDILLGRDVHKTEAAIAG